MDAKVILDEVRINHARLKSCDLHVFDPATYKPGKRMVCVKCHGELQSVRIGSYIDGYEAAGGDCNDIWPGYRDK